MKLLTTMLIFISFNVSGQNLTMKDSLYWVKIHNDTVLLKSYKTSFAKGRIDTLPFYKSEVPRYGGGAGATEWVGSVHKDIDTVKVLMLMCDTSHGLMPSGLILISDNKVKPDSAYRNPNNNVWYDWGYIIKEIEDNVWTPFGKSYINDEKPEYLDDKKRKLKPSIIVWQSFEIK